MKKYLERKDLWDVVESGYTGPSESESDVNRKRKNDLALHTIWISCRKETAHLFSDLSSAKAVWDKLAGYLHYQSLYKHIRTGDCGKTEEYVKAHPEALTAKISSQGYTPLHAAAAFQHLDIVETLVKLMSEKDIVEIFRKDAGGWTPLNWACAVGATKMAKCMVKKNEKLLTIPYQIDVLPVTIAVISASKEMVRYLYSVTPLEVLLPENGKHGATLLMECLFVKSLDMALHLLTCCPQLAITPCARGNIFVRELARMPSVFRSGCQLGYFQKWIYNWINVEHTDSVNEVHIDVPNSNTRESENSFSLVLRGINQMYETKLIHKQAQQLLHIIGDQISILNFKDLEKYKLFDSIIEAAKYGTLEFILELTKAQLELAWSYDNNGRNFFCSAVEYRQAKVFNMIYGYIWKDQAINTRDKNWFTMLHMVAKLAPQEQLNHISGAALQMQRELQWFKEVESIVPLGKQMIRDDAGMTTKDLFTKEHKNLVKEGEKWMKGTASSCTVVGALIVTIMFAVVFTVPGGNNQDTGYPIFKDKDSFFIFIISDAISLFSSSTSVLMFLGILTSRYGEDDFLKSLPTKLIIGLSLLFISIATMMVAFCSALFIMLEGKLWVIVPIIWLASVPIVLFAKLQISLLIEIFNSTFRKSIFDKNVKRWP